MFPNDLISCFETIATILLNQCQIWFEFTPLEPLNYLGIIENILAKFDPILMDFYIKMKITSKIYAWTILENACSEIFDEKQWLKLWDHVLSNKPYFLIFCVVSYSIVQKSILMKLDRIDSIEQFFHEQNNIDFQKFIKKTYQLMDNCPDDVHPKKNIKIFEPLLPGQYQKFNNFPMLLIDVRNKEIDSLKVENEILENKINELEKIEKSVNEKYEETRKAEEHEKRIRGNFPFSFFFILFFCNSNSR